MRIILIFLVIINVGCSVDRTIPLVNSEEEKILAEFQRLDEKSIVIVTNDEEPGKKMLLCLNYRSKEGKEILKNQKVLFYQATDRGEYEQTDPNDESTARLNGTVETDRKGRIFVKTVLPGDYGSTADNRHIHTTVFGAKPEAYDIHFYQYANSGLQRFITDSDQHFMANLKYTKDSTLVAFLRIEPKGFTK